LPAASKPSGDKVSSKKDFYDDEGSTYVRMDRNLRDHLYKIYSGKGVNDLKTVSDIVWHLVDKDIDFGVVEHDHPEVKGWLDKAAEDRNAAYAKRVTKEIRAKGGRIARVELQ